MRFEKEIDGHNYLVGKKIPDPKSWDQKLHATTREIDLNTQEDVKKKFDEWLELKKFMFSPQELIALRGYDYRGNKGQIDQKVRNHHINTFADWAEKKPRRKALIIVNAAYLNEATTAALQFEPMKRVNIFAIPLSPNGKVKDTPTHFMCNWNCTQSEYDEMKKVIAPWWHLYNSQFPEAKSAEEYNEKVEGLLTSFGVKRVIAGEGEGLLTKVWNFLNKNIKEIF